MGTQYLIDTNTVIEFLGGTLPPGGSVWVENVINNNLHCLSVINQIELLSYNGSVSENQILIDFIAISNVLSLTDDVVQKTINLRKQYKIKLPDAIIAATALVYDLTLVTRNISDFQKIESLVCVNAHEQV